jgi:hypothetical protein
MSKRDRMNVKVDAEVVRKAKVVAAARHVPLSDYITDLLRSRVEADLMSVAAGLIGLKEADAAAIAPAAGPLEEFRAKR